MDQTRDEDQFENQEITKTPSEVGGHAEELVDHYWGSINYVFSLIKASEIKAGLILSFYGILFNFIYQNIALVISMGPEHYFLYVLLAIWIGATTTSIYFSIRCFMPRVEGKFEKNVFFFGDVITKFGTIKEFSKTFYRISLNEVELFDQLGQQIYVNSKIASEKFKYVNRSIRLLAVGLFLLFILVVSSAIISLM
ncbi:Pycsar system effector family protein [Maribacter halichondriae]|uniref:Pycsar system effector family protein n=1 Tax=Maribacter halichondriae TaxID=2980554 RepID=UPI0023587AB3|nr:Pycsar system effector family protein [Maribacter sp. Hal144]